MFRKFWDFNLNKGFGASIIFLLVLWGLANLPTYNIVFQIIFWVAFTFLIITNICMINGLTSLENENTQKIYSLIITGIPLWLLIDKILGYREWWHYLILGVCTFVAGGLIMACFNNRTFRRSIQSIAVAMLVFCSPILYSELFIK